MYKNNNHKNSLEICFWFQLTVFENKSTFMKKTVLHTTTLIHCKTRNLLRDLFSTNKGNGPNMILVAGATKINPKDLKN